MKIGIFADSHIDYIHDALSRVEKFYLEADASKVDFCIQLGDFCSPYESKIEIKRRAVSLVKSQSIKTYHVLGNHDMDHNSKEEVLEFIGQSSAYGSFDVGGVHFIYLDANFYREGQEEISYSCGNYKSASADAELPILPKAELDWLRHDLENTEYPSVIFSHQSLIESRAGIVNAEDLRKVLRGAPSGVIACICGHEHVDRLEEKDGVIYYCLNSMSYYWAGSKYAHTTYGEQTEEEYPLLRYVFPYSEPLYAIVEITDSEIIIHGRESEIVGALPQEMNFKKAGLVDKIEPCVRNRTIKI
ncbi:MAG: hypothetical protein E7612_02800 [Ruminococcaceae bacterium]|nr:hypothetical protein [Oscillospiraceae bacterium]